jgi:hypothetical protein
MCAAIRLGEEVLTRIMTIFEENVYNNIEYAGLKYKMEQVEEK